jgi:hypothetical protein
MAVEKTWQPLPHQTGFLSIGTLPLVNTVFESLLLKSARSKWAYIDQHTKALRLSHRAVLFIFWSYFFALFPGGLPLRARAVNWAHEVKVIRKTGISKKKAGR